MIKGIILTNMNKVFFSNGRFDNWCVFCETKSKKWAPTDSEYFKFLKEMAEVFGKEKIYNDFLLIYNKTKQEIDVDVVHLIKEISKQYQDFSSTMERTLSVIYLAMIAEENKAHTVLGKRIKRLGIYNILFDNMTPQMAAEFSKGKSHIFLNECCSQRGF